MYSSQLYTVLLIIFRYSVWAVSVIFILIWYCLLPISSIMVLSLWSDWNLYWNSQTVKLVLKNRRNLTLHSVDHNTFVIILDEPKNRKMFVGTVIIVKSFNQLNWEKLVPGLRGISCAPYLSQLSMIVINNRQSFWFKHFSKLRPLECSGYKNRSLIIYKKIWWNVPSET